MASKEQEFKIALDQANLQALTRIVLICSRQPLTVTALAFQRLERETQITLKVQCGDREGALLEQLLRAVHEVTAVQRA